MQYPTSKTVKVVYIIHLNLTTYSVCVSELFLNFRSFMDCPALTQTIIERYHPLSSTFYFCYDCRPRLDCREIERVAGINALVERTCFSTTWVQSNSLAIQNLVTLRLLRV